MYFLQGDKSSREYIGCQSPIPATLAYIWRMVWERINTVVIINYITCVFDSRATSIQENK